jgi:hypothetical protein
MSVMDDREGPPPYFGDYPHGAYASVFAPEHPPASDDEEDYTVAGSELRIMWDEGAGPLWASDGLLPHEPEWLQRALGLSDPLVADLLTWLSDMTTLKSGRAPNWREQERLMDERGRDLAARLQTEVGSRYRVWFHA